jgi:hypothetical protein
MWWHDIKEIKECLSKLTSRISIIEACVKCWDEDSPAYNRFSDRLDEIDDKLRDIVQEFPKSENLDAIYKAVGPKEDKQPKKRTSKKKKINQDP